MYFIEVRGVLTYKPLLEDVSVLRGLNLLLSGRKSVEELHREFCLYLCKVLRSRLVESIKSQRLNGRRFRNIYSPLSVSYRKSKPWGVKGKFWVNSGVFLNKISYWRVGGGYRVGVRGRHGGVDISDILVWMEEGTVKMPARPLFKPVFSFVGKNIGVYWRHFLNLRYNL